MISELRCEICGGIPTANALEGTDLSPRHLCVEWHARTWLVVLAAESYMNVLRSWTHEARPSLQSLIDNFVANSIRAWGQQEVTLK